MKETDIRPQDLFNRYLELAQKDSYRFFSDHSQFQMVDCPACASTEKEYAFTKHGFAYDLCRACGSLFLSPRPPMQMYEVYYKEAESVKFWSTHFYKQTVEKRRASIHQPRAALVADLVKNSGRILPPDSIFADVGSGYGVFLEEVDQLGLFDRVIGIEPSVDLASVCEARGFEVMRHYVEAMPEPKIGAYFITAFEVLEHVLDPLSFLNAIGSQLQDHGLSMLTTLTVTGFDIQVLWDRSKSVHPPHHINLMSIAGLEKLVARSQLDLVEIATPGELDVDIVRNMANEQTDIRLPRFVSSIIHGDDNLRNNFQSFLKTNRLSSHVRICARKGQHLPKDASDQSVRK